MAIHFLAGDQFLALAGSFSQSSSEFSEVASTLSELLSALGISVCSWWVGEVLPDDMIWGVEKSKERSRSFISSATLLASAKKTEGSRVLTPSKKRQQVPSIIYPPLFTHYCVQVPSTSVPGSGIWPSQPSPELGSGHWAECMSSCWTRTSLKVIYLFPSAYMRIRVISDYREIALMWHAPFHQCLHHKLAGKSFSCQQPRLAWKNSNPYWCPELNFGKPLVLSFFLLI